MTLGIVLAVLAASLPAFGPTSAASAPATMTKNVGRIIFSSDRAGAWRIWSMREDGTDVRQLTSAGEDENDVDPAHSPDGRRILFASTRGGKAGLWVARADGKGANRLCDGDQGDWSPDGKAVAFRRGGRIFTRQFATGAEKAITPEGWKECSGPAWSPDGKRVAFASIRAGRNALFLVDPGGGEPTLLYDKEPACAPRWSPDGKTIAYETETHVFAIRPDGTDNRMVTWYGGIQRFPQWSPDGKRIVFCQGASPQGPWELYVVPAAGGKAQRLTEGASDMYPDWK